MKHLFLTISAAIMLASCAASNYSVKKGGSQVALDGSSWVLAEQVSTEQPTLVVEAGGKITGNTGCNNYFSSNVSIDAKAGSFSATNVGSTRKACVNMSVETGFLNMLQQANRYVVDGESLELYKDNLLLLKFNKK